MSPLQQYIDLYLDHRSLIEDASAPALNAMRQKALEVLNEAAKEGALSTLHPSLYTLLAPDYGINLQRLDWGMQAAASLGCAVPRLPAILVTVAGDSVHIPEALPKALEIRHISEAPGEILERFYGQIAPLGNIANALNTLLVQDGIYIHVAEGTVIDRPIQILNVLHAPVPQMAIRRVLVVMEKDSKASVLTCDHTQDDAKAYLTSRVTEVWMGRGSRLDWCDLEEATPLTGRLNGLYARQEADSHLSLNHSTLQGGTTINRVETLLEGDHAHATLAGMVTADGRQDTANHTLVVHQGRYDTSEQLYKHIADGDSHVTFDGLVNVRPDAVGTDGRQSAHTILASPGARVHAEPHLIIDCDDVRCSHGATTGTLDEDALFYMRQRGIPLDVARRMLMLAFMQQVIDTVPIEGLRNNLHTLVERRLSGERTKCAGCAL